MLPLVLSTPTTWVGAGRSSLDFLVATAPPPAPPQPRPGLCPLAGLHKVHLAAQRAGASGSLPPQPISKLGRAAREAAAA